MPKLPEQQFYTHEQLKYNAHLPPSVDRSKKEQRLTDADFEAVFGLTKVAFNAMQQWRQAELKKQKGLF